LAANQWLLSSSTVGFGGGDETVTAPTGTVAASFNLAETLHQRGNRFVTNKQFGHLPYVCCSSERFRFGAHAGQYPGHEETRRIEVLSDKVIAVHRGAWHIALDNGRPFQRSSSSMRLRSAIFWARSCRSF
jgi:hypothetical protein